MPMTTTASSATSPSERVPATSTRQKEEGGFQVPRRQERCGNGRRTTTMLSFVILVYILIMVSTNPVPSDLANGHHDTRHGTTAPTNDNPAPTNNSPPPTNVHHTRIQHPRTCTAREWVPPPINDNSTPTNGNPVLTNHAQHPERAPPPTNDNSEQPHRRMASTYGQRQRPTPR
ncbi:hypothetical protein K443DRAFT_4675 [Laccaria amethystina LaAM-08-1]|uniref:Uncharacterized protein n=1 Tax=Laccaria amethystina LaAM-08-1 TaxID=1095629 RepID=A0A0C9XHC1_9AGAR|nr:hypothetical protein K443DRAFT_4675 [Laccaria amethystina LaAM-08-1]